MRHLLDLLYLLIFPIALLARRKHRSGLWSRFLGRTNRWSAPHPPYPPRIGGLERSTPSRRVWFHGVSVGEVHLLRGVIARFRARHPHDQVIVSSTTEAGFAEAQRCFADAIIIRWPLDFSWAVQFALREFQPDLVVLAESEWWPNFLLAAKRIRIPVVAINVRLSPRSLAWYRFFKPIVRRWLGLVAQYAAQTHEYAAALEQLGVPTERITVTGSVKYDGAKTDCNNPKTVELQRLFHIGANDLVWIAGSTQAPEEDIALAIYHKLKPEHPNVRLILVPRQPERFDEVAALLRRSGTPLVRRSEAALACTADSVVLIDTIGELGAAWGLADIAFVGGSLDGKRGGQNMIEPAAYGAAVVFGPHTWNFRDTVRRLIEADAAIEVRDAAELELTVRQLLQDAERRGRLGDNAQRLVLQQQGATERTLNLLDICLPETENHRHVA
jgi:3-deoxy-D-manno-octulosonic-acid transferase